MTWEEVRKVQERLWQGLKAGIAAIRGGEEPFSVELRPLGEMWQAVPDNYVHTDSLRVALAWIAAWEEEAKAREAASSKETEEKIEYEIQQKART